MGGAAAKPTKVFSFSSPSPLEQELSERGDVPTAGWQLAVTAIPAQANRGHIE